MKMRSVCWTLCLGQCSLVYSCTVIFSQYGAELNYPGFERTIATQRPTSTGHRGNEGTLTWSPP